MTPQIVYEDDAILVIDKPVGMVVNRAASVKGETVQDWVEKNNQIPHIESQHANEDSDYYARSGIVHRIDKETSGILLIAKTPDAFRNLQSQFKDRTVQKMYLALAHGTIVPSKGTVNAPVDRLPWNRERFGVVPGGRESVTEYEVVGNAAQEGSHESISVVIVRPRTGRTHQIRVHFKYMNHPLVGDYLYAGRKTARDDRQSVGRVMLHAWQITFRHPNTGDTLAIQAPIPDDIKRVAPDICSRLDRDA